MSSKIKTIIIIVLILGLFLSGFFIGRKSINVEPSVEIKYLPGDTVTDSIEIKVPVEEITPPDTADIIRTCVRDGLFSELFPTKVRDSLIIINAQDTAVVIRDWSTDRLYSETLIDNDTLGRLIVDARVKYNRLYKLNYQFTPVIRTVEATDVIKRKFEPFGGIGVFTNGMINLHVGAYFDSHYGISYMPVYDIQGKRWVHGLQTTYKF